MKHRHSGCHPRGRIEIDVPEALITMGRRSGGWGPFHFEFDDNGWSGRRGGGRRSRRMFESGELRLVFMPMAELFQAAHRCLLLNSVESAPPGPCDPGGGSDQIFGLSRASIFGSAMFSLVTRLAPVSTKASTFSFLEAASAVFTPS